MANPLLVSLVKSAAAQRAARPSRALVNLAGLVAILLAIPLSLGLLVSVIIGAAQPTITGSCPTSLDDDEAAGETAAAASGLFAQPLQLVAGRSYVVGATTYGGPSDPTSTDYGSIPDPGQSYLPTHPDSFAELSVQATNPVNSAGGLTFADANALDNLPYLSALHVEHDGREQVLYKRDVGYGQGPLQTIANGQPYRLDVWWASAQGLGITSSPVTISLAPATGAAATLDQTPAAQTAGVDGAPLSVDADCTTTTGGGAGIPLPLTPGTQTKILPSGLAAAGQDAPALVKAMVAAGNRLYGLPYLYGGAHGPSLDTLQPAYDCSSAVSYVLHAGGQLGPSALDSTGLAGWGEPGPGRYVTVYANAGHAFMYVAGLRFDTVYDSSYDSGPNSGQAGPRWRVYAGVPGWATWTVRHPAGL